ncbi:MAG: DUF1992 domain-containing protein [Burkholderiales bacterium]|nr:DUF1992 domain-containing protein [Burkholderiales bacterium]
MHVLEWIAERRIEEAVARGELQGLPGEGRPLDLDEDPLVPEEMRMAKRILRNADVSLAEVFRGLFDELRRRRTLG